MPREFRKMPLYYRDEIKDSGSIGSIGGPQGVKNDPINRNVGNNGYIEVPHRNNRDDVLVDGPKI